MNSIYNASDFAFMIRATRNLNVVASPTKFGEYCLTGLQVIHNSSVSQVNEIISILKNGFQYNDIENAIRLNDNMRSAVAVKAKKYYSRKILNNRYIKIYCDLI